MKRLAALVPAALLAAVARRPRRRHRPRRRGRHVAPEGRWPRRLHDEAEDDPARPPTAEHAKAQKECWQQVPGLEMPATRPASRSADEKIKANNLDSRARAIERELKRREIAEKDAQRAEKDAARTDKP